ncbi:polysaccharide biosynthesis C-terminal domain-containing protein [Accumulibacter sp.]|uniref:lipopolysaccharide biosynthesis protein n=1 Tax=Accumulibacter sp. TaxID=2053492 RepID=UPI00261CB313|nr:polysaccharide biosynthesis C-terminal domain-containing protein [Accumulibacter sp.]
MKSSPEFSKTSILKNGIKIFTSRILTTILAFLTVPIVIGKLGIDVYGAWESILAISAITNLFSAVITGTLLWLISTSHGSADKGEIERYARNGIFCSVCLFAVVVPISVFFRHELVGTFNLPRETYQDAVWLLPAVVSFSFITSINEVLAALVSGLHRAGTAALIQAGASIGGSLLTIVCIFGDVGLVSLPIGLAFTAVGANCGLYVACGRVYKKIILWPLLPDRGILKRVAPYAAFMALGALTVALRDQSDKIILSYTASVAWAGYYGVAARLSGVVMVVCTFFYVPAIAAAGSLYAMSGMAAVTKLYSDLTVGVAYTVGLVVVLLGSLYDRIVVMWIGHVMPEVEAIFFLLLIGNGLAVMLTAPGTSVCKGIGLVKIEAVYIAASLALNVVLKLLLVPHFGGLGSVASSVLSWTLASCVFIWLLHKRTQLPFSSVTKTIRTILIIVLCVSLARWLSIGFPPEAHRLDAAVSATLLGVVTAGVYTAMMMLCRVISFSTILQLLGGLTSKAKA